MLELPNASGLNDLYIFIALLHMVELRDTMSSKTIRKYWKIEKRKCLLRLSGAKVAELTTNHNHEFCYAFDQEGFGVIFGGGYI